jgi:replicative DNA helicase
MERVSPHNLEAERAVISALLFDNQAMTTVMEILEPEDFYLEAHEIIFSGMKEMSNKGMPIDLITLTDHLQATAKLDVIGGPATVSSLGGLVSTSANVDYWAGIVKDKSLLRSFIKSANSLIAEALDEPEEVEEFLDQAEHKVLEISERQTMTTYLPINQVVKESFQLLDEMEKRRGAVRGVPSGFRDLDELTSGFQDSELIILAGRPSMGKTALALNIMQHAALEAEKTVAFFSLEMAAKDLVIRMICSEARINSGRIRRGDFRNLWVPLTNAAGKLGQAKIFVEDSSDLSVLELKAKARRIRHEYGLDMVIIDYLQLLKGLGTRRGRDSREQEIAEISRSLKAMAKEMEIPVMALSQLNRAPEARGGDPRLSDLRESGALEQDADVVMLLHRPGLYQRSEEDGEADDRLTRLKIEKQRNGPTGIIDLVFLKEFTKFEPFEGRYDDSSMPDATPF